MQLAVCATLLRERLLRKIRRGSWWSGWWLVEGNTQNQSIITLLFSQIDLPRSCCPQFHPYLFWKKYKKFLPLDKWFGKPFLLLNVILNKEKKLYRFEGKKSYFLHKWEFQSILFLFVIYFHFSFLLCMVKWLIYSFLKPITCKDNIQTCTLVPWSIIHVCMYANKHGWRHGVRQR